VGALWATQAEQIRAPRKAFVSAARGGARRTSFDDAPEVEEVSYESMIEREPLTVVCSEMGWIRAMKGHLDPTAELKFKDGDGPRFFLHAETTDRVLLFASNGRMYTLACATLPGGRGMGEPVRLMVDMPNEAQMVALFVHRPGEKLLVASTAGDGFVLPEDEAVAQTRAGRQILNLKAGTRAAVCRPMTGDHVAVVGENRKVLVFPRDELPEMGRGKGVRLQRYKDGGLADATTFALAQGLAWKDPAGRTRTVVGAELAEWIGARASAGRMAPRGFPRENRFG
jgi:topoisomerase-4 subunit A